MKSTTRLLRSTAGFSKIQNIMLLVIFLTLAGVGSYAFYGYYCAAYSVKAGNVAQKVYEASADYLEDKAQTGSLTEFNEAARSFGGLVSEEYQKQILQSLYEGRDFDTFFKEYQKKYEKVPVRYMILQGSAEERENNPILDILDIYVPDQDIKEHTFLIEYNGNTGEVLGVLYSKKTESFTYKGEQTEKSNVILRDAKSLKQKWQGYYGIALEELL